MFDDLPSEISALKTLLVDLHNDLHGRTERLRLLQALDADFGGEGGLMVPGGTPAYLAYEEVRHAFVSGSFLSVILLSQCLLENLLAAELNLGAISAEIHGSKPTERLDRPTFNKTIAEALRAGLLNGDDERELKRLAYLRNALSHFRDVQDPSHLDRRAIRDHTSAADLCRDDARASIVLLIRILGKPAFRPSKPFMEDKRAVS